MGLKIPQKAFKRKCPECRGKGFIIHSELNCRSFTLEQWSTTCTHCRGSGKIE